MITISLCMIVKNEEAVLARCLESIRPAVDEIILVDTGSTDRTLDIAQEYTEKVFQFPWIDDFSAARNFSFAQATMDYQMWLDADDVLPAQELAKLLLLKETLSSAVTLVTMKYHTHFDETGNPILTSTRERLTRRDANYRWEDPVHECIPLAGNIHFSDITIWHQKPHRLQTDSSRRNLDIYESLEAQGHAFTPRQQYYFARELKDHGKFQQAQDYFTRFLDGGKGWKEDNIAACFNSSLCAQALGDEASVLPPLWRSFQYDAPRAEICCLLGYYYQRRKEYETALQWFRLSTFLERPSGLGFVLEDYAGYIPHLESFVCAWHLGLYAQARVHLDQAAAYKPESPLVLQNQTLLKRLEKQNPAL